MYGIDAKSKDDEYIVQAEQTVAAINEAATANYLVDLFPSLGMLPSWAPGGTFKCAAEKWKEPVQVMPKACLNFVKEQLVSFLEGLTSLL